MEGINGVVEAVEPRSSVLTRPDYYDGLKPVAANVEQMIIVSSVLPELSLNIIDRYLVAAETLKHCTIIGTQQNRPSRYKATRNVPAMVRLNINA